MLTNSTQLLKTAREQGRCIPAFNVYNLETAAAAFQAAKNKNAPAILAFGEGCLSRASLKTIAAMVRAMDSGHPLPVVLHLDHCKELRHLYEAIDEGFTSVMYDGSALTLGENIKNTQKAVAYAHKADISVEGELGIMNPEDAQGESEGGSPDHYTDPGQARLYAAETGIDSLAVSVGNAHGLYKGVPHLNFRRLEEIAQRITIPIVLHGSSGIPEEQIRVAVATGVAKINVNTELSLSGAKEIAAFLHRNSNKNLRMEKLLDAAQAEICRCMERLIELTWL